jgi:uncharacterized membrane protein YwzB
MLIMLLVGLLIIAVVYYALYALPLPPIIKQVGTVILVVVAALWLIGLLTGHRIIPIS